MYLDYLTLAAIRCRLETKLIGARVQGIIQPSPQAFVLELYTGERQYLFLSAEPTEPAVALLHETLRRGVEKPSPLLLLLRKHIRGARLTGIHQPELERILRFTFAQADGSVCLVAELMGRRSNLILLNQDEQILDATKRLPASVNRYRTILPHQPYIPPPPQEKHHPMGLTAQLIMSSASDEPSLSVERLLVRSVGGMSPLLAREIVHRAKLVTAKGLTHAQAKTLISITQQLYGMIESESWCPAIAYRGQGEDRRADIATPYAITHQGDWQPCQDILEAVRHVLQSGDALDPYGRVRRRLHDAIHDAHERIEHRLTELYEALPSDAEISRLLTKGNAILALQHTIRPGQQELRIPIDLLEGLTGESASEPLAVTLDPTASPAENAQRCFKRREKLQAARNQLPPLIRKAKLEQRFLDQADMEVDMATSRPELDEIATELQEAGHMRKPKRRRQKSPRSEPLQLQAPDGGLILVGRNSRQNELVTFRLGLPEDIWLHAHGVPGAHVIYRPTGPDPEPATLRLAASLAAYHSAAREQTEVQVDYTPRKHVKSIRGAGPGMVTYRNEKTMVVTPTAPDELEDT